LTSQNVKNLKSKQFDDFGLAFLEYTSGTKDGLAVFRFLAATADFLIVCPVQRLF